MCKCIYTYKGGTNVLAKSSFGYFHSIRNLISYLFNFIHNFHSVFEFEPAIRARGREHTRTQRKYSVPPDPIL